MLRFLTAGESHGPALVVLLEGLPAGLPVSVEAIDEQLRRRQAGHGRGGRMQIERDRVRVLAGLRFGRTLGSPLALLLENRDWPNWEEKMAVEAEPSEPPALATVPRPGHADLPASASTASPISATSSSEPAPARRRRGWPPAPSPANSSLNSG